MGVELADLVGEPQGYIRLGLCHLSDQNKIRLGGALEGCDDRRPRLDVVSGSSVSGGCLCGGVRFELTEPPAAAGYCHCTRCQRHTGSASSAQARVDGRTFHLVQGEELIKGWRHPEGGFEKFFCRECGAHCSAEIPTTRPR